MIVGKRFLYHFPRNCREVYRKKGLSIACLFLFLSHDHMQMPSHPAVHGSMTLNVLGKGLSVAFVEDSATMSSIRHLENHVSYFVQKPQEVNPIKHISLRQISVSIAFKYIINNSVLK